MKEFIEYCSSFYTDSEWDAFRMNIFIGSIFFFLSIPVAVKLIPYYIVKKLKRDNKKHIIRKVSYVIQEICEYLNDSPFKDTGLNKKQLAIMTSKRDIKTYRFVGLVNINVFDEIVFPTIFIVVSEYFGKLSVAEQFKLLTDEKERITCLRETLERIIEVHSLHLDEKILLEISEVCLDIRSFEINFKFNNAMDDLIEKGVYKREYVFNKDDLALLYQGILMLLRKLINRKDFETEITLRQE